MSKERPHQNGGPFSFEYNEFLRNFFLGVYLKSGNHFIGSRLTGLVNNHLGRGEEAFVVVNTQDLEEIIPTGTRKVLNIKVQPQTLCMHCFLYN